MSGNTRRARCSNAPSGICVYLLALHGQGETSVSDE